jgi:hypothetical protein
MNKLKLSVITGMTLSMFMVSCSKENLEQSESTSTVMESGTSVVKRGISQNPNYSRNGDEISKRFVFLGIIDIEIKFGMHIPVINSTTGEVTTTDCAGHGLCELDISLGGIANPDGSGVIGIDEDRVLMIELEKESMSDSDISNLQTGVINVYNDFVLKEEICNELGLSPNYTIPAGDYNVQEYETTFLITL